MQQLWSVRRHNTVKKYYAAISATAVTQQLEYNMAPNQSQYIYIYTQHRPLHEQKQVHVPINKAFTDSRFCPQCPSVLAVTFA